MLDGKIIFLNSWCKFAGGYQTVPGEIRGRLLKISYVAHIKKAPLSGARRNFLVTSASGVVVTRY